MKANIGVNLASYLPFAAVLPQAAEKAAREGGYKFLQALPFRYMEGVGKIVPISYLEHGWNPATSLGQVVRGVFTNDPLAPKLIDWAFFQNRDECERTYQHLLQTHRPRIIAHEFGEETDLVEVHPGLWMSPERIVEEVEKRGLHRPLVIDLWHARRPPRQDNLVKKPQGIPSVSLLGAWQTSLPKLLPHTCVIHVSPRRDGEELEACLRGKPTELGDMLSCVQEARVPIDAFVVEATIGIGGLRWNRLTNILADFRCWLADELVRMGS